MRDTSEGHTRVGKQTALPARAPGRQQISRHWELLVLCSPGHALPTPASSGPPRPTPSLPSVQCQCHYNQLYSLPVVSPWWLAASPHPTVCQSFSRGLAASSSSFSWLLPLQASVFLSTPDLPSSQSFLPTPFPLNRQTYLSILLPSLGLPIQPPTPGCCCSPHCRCSSRHRQLSVSSISLHPYCCDRARWPPSHSCSFLPVTSHSQPASHRL